MPALTFGEALRNWRTTRRYSQMHLALDAEVSTRHLSYLETGKSKPSREMVLHLARVLDVPLRDRNDLLVAAGYAPVFEHTPLTEPAMETLRGQLEQIVHAHAPAPAFLVDAAYQVQLCNAPAAAVATRLVEAQSGAFDGGFNLARLALHPDGLRPHLRNWPTVAAVLMERIDAERRHRPTHAGLAALYEEVAAYPGVAEARRRRDDETPLSVVIPVELDVDGVEIRLFTTIASIGTAADVTVDELRLETLWPVDEASARALATL
jgi:transcriptional regulator with XRE-family HTH domain